ncbi:hypothetical protein EK21DRAFT_83438 [Setomelanomma holmii]|uniref:Uncharacterized protein n=1 Tax=Setomelanomma holmii TaxID=210430 RepID=A0A9P4LSI6_9PLEO|nr:hypothetical protein EK21DRAFT_83438 [Setomelanomma holmii]
MAALFPDHIDELPNNMSFALVYQIGHLLSFSESSDAMYLTERMPDNDTWSALTPSWIKAERRVLSCWQESTMCVRGECDNVFNVVKSVSPGLITILTRLHSPMITSIANSLSAAALMSFSLSPGSTVDAATSSTFSDMERLSLGAYLLSRNILRDSTMTGHVAGFKYAVLNSKGQQLEGTGDFVLEVGSVTALSLPAIIPIPALTLLFLLLTVACNYLAHPRKGATTLRAQRERMINLVVPNLYRIANMQVGKAADYDYVRCLHPIPASEGDEMAMPLLAYTGG